MAVGQVFMNETAPAAKRQKISQTAAKAGPKAKARPSGPGASGPLTWCQLERKVLFKILEEFTGKKYNRFRLSTSFTSALVRMICYALDSYAWQPSQFEADMDFENPTVLNEMVL